MAVRVSEELYADVLKRLQGDMKALHVSYEFFMLAAWCR